MNNAVTQQQRLDARLADLQRKLSLAMKGRLTPSPRALELMKQIDHTRAEQKLNREREREEIAMKKIPVDRALEILMIPLLADVLNDLCAGVDATLREYKCQETVFASTTRLILRNSLKLVDTLAGADARLPQLLDHNDMLIDAIKKKTMSFIKQHLNIRK